MNEIFSNEVSQLTLNTSVRGAVNIPSTLPTAKLYVSNTDVFSGTPVNLDVTAVLDLDSLPTGVYHVAIPYGTTQEKRYAKVEYEYELTGYGVIASTELFEIRTRLISYEEYLSMTSSEGDGFEAFSVAETEARLTVEQFTRQRFSKWTGSLSIDANPNRIYLPQHLRSLTSLSLEGDYTSLSSTSEYIRDERGFVLYKASAPDKKAGLSRFTIEGKWGYESVPIQVKNAAYELTRDFSSSVINKRRQYLLNSGSGSLGGTFTDSADLVSWKAYSDSTGNAVADQLLLNYRLIQPGII